MKRCPQCNRVETDEALKFCRIDGTTLVSDSSPINSEAGTAQLSSSPHANEDQTNMLPHRTDPSINRATAPTTVLPSGQPMLPTQQLAKRRSKRGVIAIAALLLTAVVVLGYFVT